MAYFAELDSDNNILNVLIVSDEDVIANGGHQSEQASTWVKNTFGKTNPSNNWIEGSNDSSFRGHMPSVGGSYLASENVIRLPKYFPSWVWNTAAVDWQSPLGAKPAENIWPTDTAYVFWSEHQGTWVAHVEIQKEDITVNDQGVVTAVTTPEIYQLRNWDNLAGAFDSTGTEVTKQYDL